jgi:putative oxygen-independent coproporphyrinogen III oxidase
VAAPAQAAGLTAPAAATPLAGAIAGVRSLYVHVPFCERRCEYCDFASVAGLAGHEDYVEALRGEIAAVLGRLPAIVLDTVFIGGGTPSLIPPELLASILATVRKHAVIAPGAEVTMEANPSSTDAERARAWREAGVNRVSLGVQSLHAPTLRFLGRVHDAERAVGAVGEVRAAGFERVSTDLIHSVPTLDDAAWADTVERVLALGCDHLSAYELTVEAGTPLHRDVERGVTRPVGEETALRQHWMVVDAAAGAGLAQYEVSNLARPGEECRHNLAYWANASYLAVGVGAHGHVPPEVAVALGIADAPAGTVAVRYRHDRHPAAYVRRAAAAPEDANATVSEAEVIDAGASDAERLMVGLRRTAVGVELRGPAVLAEARALEAAGLLELGGAAGATARVTRRGQDVLSAVALRLTAVSDPEVSS